MRTLQRDEAASGQAAEQDDDVDEQFARLLDGLRTTLPGVQVLFGFLLAIPFHADVEAWSEATRRTHLVALGAAALGSTLLIAPSVHQRMRAPATGMRRHSRHHLQVAVHLANAGTALGFVALVAGVVLATGQLAGAPVVVTVAAAVGAVGLWAWLWLPLVEFRRDRHSIDR